MSDKLIDLLNRASAAGSGWGIDTSDCDLDLLQRETFDRIEWLENDRRELAAMLDFYLTDETSDGWGMQTKATRDAFRADVWPNATSAFGMWEEDAAAAEEA